MQTAERLKSVEEYYFSKKLREIKALEAEGKKIINLGIGSPDLPPPDSVLIILKENAQRIDVHQYQSYQGLPEFRKAITRFYLEKYGVALNYLNEVLPLMGSKEGITHISLAYLNKGDKVLIPELGYPTYTSVTKMVEAEPIYYPMLEIINWEPDWSYFEKLNYDNIKILYVNYPHMPTGAVGSDEILRKFVKIAIENNLLLVHDNPYSFILNDHPRSIFNIEGSKDVALELNSLSKTFNMSGWRIGWVCGDSELINNILRIKSNMDSGMFKPLQLAAIEALGQGNDWFDYLSDLYIQRRSIAMKFLDSIKCQVQENQSGMFVWAKTSENTEELIDKLLYENGIFVTPGHIFGERGRSFIRVSLCSPVAVFEEAINRVIK